MAEDSQVEGEGGSGKVFLIMGLLLGIGAGAGGGYFFFADKNTGSETSEKSAPKKARQPLISVPFERIAVPIYAEVGNSRRFIGNYFIDINVQVEGETNQIAIKRSVSQLTHGFISAISKANLMQEDNRTELDMDKASDVLKRKAVEIMGSGIVESVTITEAVRMPR